MSNTCTGRVWDNGDMTSCDSSPVIGTSSRCAGCLRHSLDAMSKEIAAMQEKLYAKQEELRKLQVSALG